MIRTMVMVAALVLGVSVCLAQSQDRLRITALLRITSPADRTIVYAGETISVSVSADPSVTVVAVIGEDPIGATHEPTAGPVQFSLTIPPRTPVDEYHIRAFGRISAGRPVASEPITLFVENRLASGVRSLRVEPRLLRFEALGHFMPLRVVGTLPDRSEIDLSYSVTTTYASTDTKVATVDKRGVVTAVGPGKAVISIRFAGARTAVPVEVK